MMEDRRGGEDLFREQWVHWQPRIYAYIRTVVFNRSDAEDLLQEVAAVLWRKIEEFEPGTRFDQWAFGVARNKVLNFQKKKGRERVRFSEAFEEVLAGEAAAASGKSGDLLETLETCVEKLPAHHRELLRRRYEPEATSRSVAQTVGRSESAISRTLNTIYLLLMSCIEGGAGTGLSTGSNP
jgi:RNA polymerase sigma-70 factor (ECF subfamily)